MEQLVLLEKAHRRTWRIGASILGSQGVEVLTPEGFLYPDTYYVESNINATDLIRLMLDNFWNSVRGLNYAKALERLGLTLDEWVILASMVEAEARVPEERKIIASLYYSRLRVHSMLLQCDPTVKYGLIMEGKWKGS